MWVTTAYLPSGETRRSFSKPAAVGQGEFLDHLAGGCVDDADDRCDALGVSAAGVQMIRHQQKPPVPGDVGGYRFALNRDAA